ncbi:MAG: pyroglutamyl-peptidase I [Christensenellaceae bacterium]
MNTDILVTGFEPFGHEALNPSQLLMEAVRDQVHTCLLPTSYRRSIETLYPVLEQLRPRIVLCLGQAGGRSAMTLERIGINWMEASIPDNDGCLMQGQLIDPLGPGGYLSTLDLAGLLQVLRGAGIAAQISLSAGTFVCNRVLYGALHWAAKHHPSMQAGFLHVPFLPEQVVDKPEKPAMEFHRMLQGVQALLQAVKTYT